MSLRSTCSEVNRIGHLVAGAVLVNAVGATTDHFLQQVADRARVAFY